MRTLLVLAVMAGCVADEGDDETYGVDTEELVTSNRIAFNGLTLNRALLGTVAEGSLSTAGARAPALFATTEGREHFSYLVSCALKPGGSVTVTASGVTYTYAGGIGLANGWASAALPTRDHKLVSACMLARANYFGISVPISLRGTGITTSPSEKAAFSVVEAAFWGDVFTVGAPLRACASPLKLSGSTVSTLPLRECAVSLDGVLTKCGFGYAGDCTSVCKPFGEKGYEECAGYKEALTVVLATP